MYKFKHTTANYHARCIEIDIAWKSFAKACKNLSTSQTNDDTKYIKFGVWHVKKIGINL